MVTDVGCDGIALNFRPVSSIGQSINYIHPWVQEIQAFKNIYQKHNILSNPNMHANAVALPVLQAS